MSWIKATVIKSVSGSLVGTYWEVMNAPVVYVEQTGSEAVIAYSASFSNDAELMKKADEVITLATLKIQEVSMASINKMFAASKSPWRERSMGVWGDQWGLHLCHGLNREGNFEIYINMDGGGCGGAAYSTRDGIPVAGCPQQCGMDLPDVEFNEMNFPLFFQYKKLKKNSGGPGKFRGGLGLEYSWSIYGVKEMTNVIFYQREEEEN